MEPVHTEIAVIGAGVVGLAIALRLAQAGHEVVILDPAAPGSGASYGNAGTVADYAVQPVGTPAVLRALPSLLFNRNSPLAIRHAALPTLAPWLLRFARQSLPGAAERNARVLAGLLADSGQRWSDLAAEIGGAEILQQKGCLYLYERSADRRAAESDIAFRRTLGVTVEMLKPDELAALEPALPPAEGGAAFFPQAIFMTDPGQMVALLAKAATDAGATQMMARADKLERTLDGIHLSGPGLRLHARRVVIAAGAHSRGLAAQAGDKVPLDTERGYHVEWDMPTPRLSRPVCHTARGFYLCPMHGRLRVVGTVELGGLTAPPSPHRIARLVEGARAIFPGLGSPSRDWMGFRPSMPDSLPVIGASAAGPDVIHAYGHGHLGLTLAPLTGAIVAALIAGKAPPVPTAPLSPGRF
ncbi:NAD(P)/FAD-dependent oxidoreductase [Frigidibacter mobilis]|uniref:D-amino acid dehydrogenase n=1 Tax=Frigidibacter mobilis TaxID=1335048 RepID=A0A159Z1J0_9RHOB|nr:FAD-dependent oxidoreductase [Frigidibacter mobilis]AMY67834.1 D-amino acid dehydrogenase [Frigidibacter mobilis]